MFSDDKRPVNYKNAIWRENIWFIEVEMLSSTINYELEILKYVLKDVKVRLF